MIDQWVLRRVLVDFGRELRAHPHLWVSINVSGASICNPGFVDFLESALRESGIDPRRLQLEITETAAVHHLERATDNLRRTRVLGCRIALDDFGAGLSSYSYLKAFAPDCIKIDGSLVHSVVDAESVDAQIVRSIINLSRRLGIESVGEHVSSPEILSAMRALGVDKVQGFELGRPHPLPRLFESL